MRFLFLLAISFRVMAGFQDIDSSDLYHYQKINDVKPTVSVIKRNTKKINLKASMDKLLEQDRLISSLLERQEKSLIIRKKSEKITALTRIKGTVLNSILAMNIKPSKFIVRLSDENELLADGEIRCLGYSFQKRVPAKCNLLVIDDHEYPVDIDLWDLDGAEGIIADYFYSGQEKEFLTSSLSAFLEGILDTAKDRIVTPYGEETPTTAKNKALSGLMGIAGNVRSKIDESAERNLSISYVNSGKEVLVFFNQSLNLDKEK